MMMWRVIIDHGDDGADDDDPDGDDEQDFGVDIGNDDEMVMMKITAMMIMQMDVVATKKEANGQAEH